MNLNDILENEVLFTALTLVVAYLICVIYKYFRNHTSVSVNCWFCNCNIKVAYKTRNEWICFKCGQFNGFNKDGGYSKVIPEQYDESLNNKWSYTQPRNKIPSDNGLCQICNANQELKITQLARYVPYRDDKYDEEIEAFRKKLELAYKLCPKCELVLQNSLTKKAYPFSFKPHNKMKQSKYTKMIFNKWTKLTLLITASLFFFYFVIMSTKNPISYISVFLPHIPTNLIYFILSVSMNLLSFRISYLENSKTKKIIAWSLFVVFVSLSCVEYLELFRNFTLIKVIVLVTSIISVIYILIAPKRHPKVVYNYKFQKLPSDDQKKIIPEEEVKEKVVPCKISKHRFSVDTMMCNEISHLNLGYNNKNNNNKKKKNPFETRKVFLTPSKLDVVFNNHNHNNNNNDSSRESVSTDSSGYDSVYNRNVHDFDNSDFLYKYNYYASMHVPPASVNTSSNISNRDNTHNSSIVYVWLTSLTFFVLGYFVREILTK